MRTLLKIATLMLVFATLTGTWRVDAAALTKRQKRKIPATSSLPIGASTSGETRDPFAKDSGNDTNSRIQEREGELNPSTRLMGFHEPCRQTDECDGGAVCKTGFCTTVDKLNRGEVGEACSSDFTGGGECLSGVCKDYVCQPSFKVKANNGDACVLNELCRSGVCGADGHCQASSQFQGLPGATCVANPSCVSGVCVQETADAPGVCGNGRSTVSSCARVGESAKLNSECCSNQAAGGKCLPVHDEGCTSHGECRSSVGRRCADVAQTVTSAEQCCSGKANGTRCVNDFANPYQPCSRDSACRSNYCNAKTSTCDTFQSSTHAPPGNSPNSRGSR